MSQVLPPQIFQVAPRLQAGSTAAESSSEAAALAWQREMERAQMTQWFQVAPKTRLTVQPPATQPAQTAREPEPSAGALRTDAAKHSPSVSWASMTDQSAPKADQDLQTADGVSNRHNADHVTQPTGRLHEQPGFEASEANGRAAPGVTPVGEHGVATSTRQQVNASFPSDRTAAPLVGGMPDVPAVSNESKPLGSLAALRSQLVDLGEQPAQQTSEFDSQMANQFHKVHSDKPQASQGAQWVGAQALLDTIGVRGVRCYAQWSERDVKVWLGVDGSLQEQNQQLSLIVSELKQFLNDQGHVLGAVVCNGRTVLSGDPGGDIHQSDEFVSALEPETPIYETPATAPGTYKFKPQQE